MLERIAIEAFTACSGIKNKNIERSAFLVSWPIVNSSSGLKKIKKKKFLIICITVWSVNTNSGWIIWTYAYNFFFIGCRVCTQNSVTKSRSTFDWYD